jgi:hypothetical protein
MQPSPEKQQEVEKESVRLQFLLLNAGIQISAYFAYTMYGGVLALLHRDGLNLNSHLCADPRRRGSYVNTS